MHDEVLQIIRDRVRLKKMDLCQFDDIGKIIGQLRVEGFIVEKNNFIEITKKGREINFTASKDYDLQKIIEKDNVEFWEIFAKKSTFWLALVDIIFSIATFIKSYSDDNKIRPLEQKIEKLNLEIQNIKTHKNGKLH
jgi:hypothetical protein